MGYSKGALISLCVVAAVAWYYLCPKRRAPLFTNGFEPDPPALRKRLWASVGIWVVSYYIMGVFGGAFAMWRMPRTHTPEPVPLRDVGMELIDFWCPLQSPNNVQSLVLLVFYLYLGKVTLFHPEGRLILQRYLHLSALMFLSRTTTVGVTSLPSPNPAPGCILVQNSDFGYWESIMAVNGKGFPPHACGDLIYSGHTGCTLLALFLFHYHKCFSSWAITLVFWAGTLLAMYSLISCRSHYTVDVVLGMYFAYFLSEWYFRRADDPRGGVSRNRLIAWLEGQHILLHTPFSRWGNNAVRGDDESAGLLDPDRTSDNGTTTAGAKKKGEGTCQIRGGHQPSLEMAAL